jgi:hypothetical protein
VHDRESPLLAVAAVSEVAKAVTGSAVKLHLLGVNARALAARFGAEARGFAVLSAEWVRLGTELKVAMRELEALTERIVRGISASVIRRRRVALLRRAEQEIGDPGRAFTFEVSAARAADQLGGAQEALRAAVDEAQWGCMFGLVIARTARIEAARSAQARTALTALSADFEAHLASISPSLRELAALELKGLT